MALTSEQVRELKDQLKGQIGHLSPEQKAQAEKQIEDLSPEALETMLNQQMSGEGNVGGASGGAQKGIFRMLVDGEIPAKKIDENKEVIVIVSKKAISKGHCLIIPKKVIADSKLIPSSAFSIAKKLARKIDSKLKANGSVIVTEGAFGEVIVNVIPIYDKPVSINSQRYDASDAEIEEIYQRLKVVKKEKKEVIKQKVTKEENVLRLPRRIP